MGYLELAKQVVKDKLGIQVKNVVPQTTPQPIPQETLNGIFTKATSKLEDLYQGGEYEHCRIHHPELYRAERDALNQVDSLWFDALAGKASLDVFRQAVNRWEKSVVEIIKVKNS